MGINTHYYTVYGIMYPEYTDVMCEALDEKHEVLEENPDVDVITDGMCGKYTIIGKILFDSGDLRYNDIEDTYVEINPAYLKMYKVKATNAFNALFPDLAHMTEGEWKIMTFMHLS